MLVNDRSRRASMRGDSRLDFSLSNTQGLWLRRVRDFMRAEVYPSMVFNCSAPDTSNIEVLHHLVQWNTLARDARQIANISHEDEACEPYV
jgi:hypothetical protein